MSNELVDIFGDLSPEEMVEHKNELASGGREEALPAGEYTFVVDTAEIRETQASGERYVFVQLSVQGGAMDGRTMTIPFMIHASDGQRMARARNELAVLMGACQVAPRDGVGALLDCVFTVQVDTYVRKRGERKGETANAVQWKTAESKAKPGAAKAKPAASSAPKTKRWG